MAGSANIPITGTPDPFEHWRARARRLLKENVPPEACDWTDPTTPQQSLWTTLEDAHEAMNLQPAPPRQPNGRSVQPTAPRAFVALAKKIALHRDADRWTLLYRVLWRLTRGGEHDLLSDAVDDDIHRLHLMERAVARDAHKMTAFVRFRETRDAQTGATRYLAWYRPDHQVLRRTGPFFATRFADMHWTIFTPRESADWNGQRLLLGGGVPLPEVAPADVLEDLWRTYYASAFNPSRLNLNAMTREMPKRFWRQLPEAQLIDELTRQAPSANETMARQRTKEAASAADHLPAAPLTLDVLRQAAADCRGCALCETASQTVFGEGPPDARLVLVGEQPGDHEDRAGRPFVGPAGQLLDQALLAANLDRDTLYITNAVKHFHHTQRGKRRIHAKPKLSHIRACRPWLDAEIDLIKPRLIVALGATAGQALLGPTLRITRDRGQCFDDAPCGVPTFVTEHPSAILRRDPPDRDAAFDALVSDLRQAREFLPRLL